MAIMKVVEGLTFTAEAASDHSSNLHKFCTLNASGEALLSGDGDKALGVITEVNLSTTTPFGPVTIQYGGIAKVKAAGAISIGDRVQSDSAGLATPGTANPAGLALTQATAASQVISVALIG